MSVRPAASPLALSCSSALAQGHEQGAAVGGQRHALGPWLLRRPVCGGCSEPKSGRPSRAARRPRQGDDAAQPAGSVEMVDVGRILVADIEAAVAGENCTNSASSETLPAPRPPAGAGRVTPRSVSVPAPGSAAVNGRSRGSRAARARRRALRSSRPSPGEKRMRSRTSRAG